MTFACFWIEIYSVINGNSDYYHANYDNNYKVPYCRYLATLTYHQLFYKVLVTLWYMQVLFYVYLKVVSIYSLILT